jgi:hypothetical protein
VRCTEEAQKKRIKQEGGNNEEESEKKKQKNKLYIFSRIQNTTLSESSPSDFFGFKGL